jgi:hypothetical protein
MTLKDHSIKHPDDGKPNHASQCLPGPTGKGPVNKNASGYPQCQCEDVVPTYGQEFFLIHESFFLLIRFTPSAFARSQTNSHLNVILMSLERSEKAKKEFV